MRNWNYALVMAHRFPDQAESDLTYLIDQKKDDETIIEIGYRKLLNSQPRISCTLIGSLNLGYQLIYLSLTLYGKWLP